MKYNLALGWALVSALTLFNSSKTFAAGADGCPDDFDLIGAESGSDVDVFSQATTERHSLSDFARLVTDHPASLLNAAQILHSEIMFFGKREEYISGYGTTKQTVYSAFAGDDKGGLPEANGRLIIGNERVIADFVNHLKLASAGGSEKKRWNLFIGPPGTGKSEILEIALMIGKILELYNEKFFRYTFQWVGLEKIPGMDDVLANRKNEYDIDVLEPFLSPINESPIALFPASRQKLILDKFGGPARQLAGTDLEPKLELNPQDADIRKRVLEYERRARIVDLVEGALAKAKPDTDAEITTLIEIRKMSKKSATDTVMTAYRRRFEQQYLSEQPLTDGDIVQILSRYTEVVRHWVGKDGVKPLATGQEKDVPQGELLIGQNPVFFGLQKSPFADKIGKFPAANLGPYMYDEFFRFPKGFRDVLLSYIESGNLSLNGSYEYALDIYLIVAANTESMKTLVSEEKPNPLLDRSVVRKFPYTIVPRNIGKTMIHMKGKRPVEFYELDNPTEVKPIEINTISPIAGYSTPTGKYVVTYKVAGEPMSGPRRIVFEPHVIEYMSEVAALTRMIFDTNVAAAAGAGGMEIITRQEFKDPIMRLKILTGDLQVEAPIERALRTVSGMVNEGSEGLTSRDLADKWLSAMISKVAGDPKIALSPSLARATFKDLLDHQGINYGEDIKTMDTWKRFADMVFLQRTILRYQADMIRLQTDDPEAAFSLYDEVYAQLQQLTQDYLKVDRLQYVNSRGESVAVDVKRLREIATIYQEATGNRLNVNELLKFAQANTGTNIQRSPQLLAAVRGYRAKLNSSMYGYAEMLNALENSDGRDGKRQERASSVLHEATRSGYTRQGLIDMLQQLNIANSLEN